MPSSLLEYLDESEGTDELYEMLRSRLASEIEEVCKTFPIETLRLDWDSIQRLSVYESTRPLKYNGIARNSVSLDLSHLRYVNNSLNLSTKSIDKQL